MNGPVEPAAAFRGMARELRQVYIALINEGFTEHEALAIIGQIIAAQAGGGK